MSLFPPVNDIEQIPSPALLFFKERIVANTAEAVRLVGNPDRLRPHVKTHKTREIVGLQIASGVRKFKCATLAEAEMTAQAGARDIFLAYPIVGPNRNRMVQLMQAHPNCRFSVAMDDASALEALAKTMADAGLTLDVFLDLNVGQNRTGIAAGAEAEALYQRIAQSPGLRPAGFHVYDGHNHQANPDERSASVESLLKPVFQLRRSLETSGFPVPTLVVGGTPTFPIYARLDIPGVECSPGTCFLSDHGYGSKFTDMKSFQPAAALLTRVISKPTSSRLTLDLGYKAVASDPPAGQRLIIDGLNDYQAVLHNEEHLVLETPHTAHYAVGHSFLAMPTHICPTCSMHQQAYVIENGQCTGTWKIVGRDRILGI